ncbi:MAG: MATE family efflux transporter [Eubacteriales bacterium]
MSNKNREQKLGTEPIIKLVFSLAMPAVIAQVVNVLYNIVDRMYIGHIEGVGATALTGVGVCFPILTLISAFTNFVGMGGAPLAAIQMGKGRNDKAERILGNGVIILLAFSIVLSLFFRIYMEPLLYAFGASDATIVYSMEYLNIYLWGTIFVQMALGLNVFISCQGYARTAMCSVLIGAFTNIVLDPIFIFGFGWGVKGAALATIISQACSATWVVTFLCSKRTTLRIRKEYLKPNWKIIGTIAAMGISPFVMSSTESLVTITLNSGLQKYGGDLYVGTMTILQSVMQLITVPMMGFAQGTQSIVSYNYGAHNKDRIKKTVLMTLCITSTMVTLYCLLAWSIPGAFASMFTNDTELIALCEKVLPIFMGGIWMMGVQSTCQHSFMAMGQAKISLFLALLRKVILLVPLAIVFPKIVGVMGIYYAEPVADIGAALTTGTMFLLLFNKIIKKEMGE